MSTDYDSPRVRPEDEPTADSLEELQSAAARARSNPVLIDESGDDDSVELPGADLSGEELIVAVIPQQRDEFVCGRCFLVLHVSRRQTAGKDICRDCA